MRKRILWVKAGGLVPVNTGGNIRSFNILKDLARKNDVTLFTFYAAQDDDKHQELEKILGRVIARPQPIPTGRGSANAIGFAQNVFSEYPYAISKYTHASIRQELAHLVSAAQFDVVVCDFVFPAANLPWPPRLPTVIFTHNVEAMIWRRHHEVATNPLWKILYRHEWRRMQAAEDKFLRAAGHVLAVSENDQQLFRSFLPPEKITVIPTGVDTDHFRPEPGGIEPHTLVFVGSMDWPPNEDGAVWLEQAILPLVQRQVPNVKLLLVGRKPSAKTLALARSNPAVEVTGTVPDVRPYLRRAAVVVVPLRVGSGTRLKIFEAMSAGKAVVSTPLGAEGLPVHHGSDILLAEHPDAFATEVIGLLQHPTRRQTIEVNARKLVVEKHGWGQVAAQFDAVLDRAIADFARR